LGEIVANIKERTLVLKMKRFGAKFKAKRAAQLASLP
jgi:hypothetical protein